MPLPIGRSAGRQRRSDEESNLGICRDIAAAGEDEVSMKNKLRELRAKKGWSQAELADRLEVSRQSVNAIETGKYDPSLPLAFRLARLFGKRIEEIFEEE
jgi:putative transcriptional regulator